jgi:hypothetical protein
MTSRRSARCLVAAAAIAGAACARQSREADTQSAPGPTPVGAPEASAAPADHLAPGELVESARKALGVALPQDLQVTQSFIDLVSATGPVSVHALVQYLAGRLEGGSLREGKEAASFEHVHARGIAEPELYVRIDSVLGGSRLEIHKVTHLPASPMPDEASRWRQVGLTPQGKLLDPMHID